MATPAQVALKFKAAANAYARLDDVTVREAARVAKAAIEGVAPSHLRGVGKRGAKLSIGTTFTGGPTPSATLKAKGPWPLVERDTKAHQIPRQRSTRTFEGVFGHAVVPGGAEGGVHGKRGVRTRVQHPGTRGKHPWARGVTAATPLIAATFRRSGEQILRALF